MTTNTTKKAAGASNTNGLHTDTNGADFASQWRLNQAPACIKITATLRAACARLKSATGSFYIDHSIGLDTVAMLILVAVFVTVRVFK